MDPQLAMFIVSVLLSGMNIVVILRAAAKFGAMELMINTMWKAFTEGRFVHHADGIAHDTPSDMEHPQ